MRAASSLVLLLVGCNEVYGLDSTIRRDAAFFDAGIDAPHQCPPIGTPPRFSQRFRQVVTQSCRDFVVARTGRTLAFCRIDSLFTIGEGMLGQPMTPARGFDLPGTDYFFPRLSPDGETAILRMTIPAGTYELGVFARGATAWELRSRFTVPDMRVTSAITTNRHLIVATSTHLQELVDDGAGFRDLQVHTFAALGLDALQDQIQLTADGLRLLVYGRRAGATTFQLLYADRANDTAPFSPFVPMPDLDFLFDGFMTEDCAHMYFSGLSQIFSTEPN
jgi:hypothetical protein